METGTGGEIVADFVQIMKNWRRMCKVYTVFKHECEGCPLENIAEHACGAIFEPEFADVVNWQKVEGIVEKWATEHPEPVYPTWCEWLYEDFLLWCQTKHPGRAKDENAWYDYLYETPIPSDIAKKLGIKPKEK